ncbi:MAG TPA: hypothetical protein VMV83_08545 [Rectinemataceae bacterium]|nr:hypothetical protein [Rectinemataceae bacterium]
MGLLAKASKEAHNTLDRSSIEGNAHPGNEASFGHEALAANYNPDAHFDLAPFKVGSPLDLQTSLPGKSDFLGILVEPAKGEIRAEEANPRLLAHIKQALGPSSIFFSAKGKMVAFASPKGEWDPEIYKLQLMRSIRNRLGEPATASWTISVGRFARRAPDLEAEVAKFAGL